MAKEKTYTRINLNFPNDLLKEVDEYTAKMGLGSRTSAICLMVSTYLDQKKTIDAMNKIDLILEALNVEQGKK